MAKGLYFERGAGGGHLQARQGDHRHRVAEPDPLHHDAGPGEVDAAARQEADRGAEVLRMDGDLRRRQAQVRRRGGGGWVGGAQQRGAGLRGRERPAAEEEPLHGLRAERLRWIGERGHLPYGGLHRRLGAQLELDPLPPALRGHHRHPEVDGRLGAAAEREGGPVPHLRRRGEGQREEEQERAHRADSPPRPALQSERTTRNTRVRPGATRSATTATSVP
ncbi:MAG TPA: hypothetical protein VFB81_20335, partial [Myxococcales bacterium]|nr:hypothetical protein [Myxococcales bacterium]